MTPRSRVLVVGGGLAGLAAAVASADGGADVTLLESRSRLGGATFSFRREGLWVDNGQHVFLRCCSAYRGFLRRIGSEDRTILQPKLSIPVIEPSGTTGTLSRNGLPAPLHLARAMATYPFLSPMERLRAAMAAWALGRLDPDDPELDRQTFGSWLRRNGQSPRAVEALWDLIAVPTLNLHAEDASLSLAVKVFRAGLLDERDAADVGYAAAPLGEVHGEAAARALARAGATVASKAPVRRVVTSGEAGFDVEADGHRFHADAVIAAVPHDEAATILPPGAVPSEVARLGWSPIVNVHVVYDRRVMTMPFAAGLGTPVQWVFDRTAPSGLERGQYLAVSISGADREIGERTDALRERFLPALAAMFPRARDARVISFFVTREHHATFRQAPGTAALRPGPRTGLPGLFLAGAWTDTGWPATMEGAVRSGLAAANAARQVLGVRGTQERDPERLSKDDAQPSVSPPMKRVPA